MRQFTFLLSILCLTSMAQDLSRRAKWQAEFSLIDSAPGTRVVSVEKNSPLEKAGIKQGDIILSVEDIPVQSSESWTSITYAIRGDRPTRFLVRRGAETFKTEAALKHLDRESHPGHDTYYESITNDYGISQRVIITKPRNVSGPQPAIFLLQGLSCSTIETYSERGGNWAEQIRTIVEQSGMVVMRIDKPGVGDSEGDCASTDFLTELSGYKAAIRMLKSKAYVDSSKIVVYGSSMGSALAPLLANEFNLAGVISDGTFFKTWFEHMLEIERRLRKMNGDSESTILKKMNEAYIPLYYGMLILKKSYGEIIEEYPAIAQFNYHPPAHMYGRPVKYYQQLQDFDLAGAWEQLKAPVRILYGTNDWIMSEFDNDMIIDVLDKAGHEDHQLVKYPGLDHWNTIHKTPEDSYFGRPGEWDPEVPALIIKWAKEMVR